RAAQLERQARRIAREDLECIPEALVPPDAPAIARPVAELLPLPVSRITQIDDPRRVDVCRDQEHRLLEGLRRVERNHGGRAILLVIAEEEDEIVRAHPEAEVLERVRNRARIEIAASERDDAAHRVWRVRIRRSLGIELRGSGIELNGVAS